MKQIIISVRLIKTAFFIITAVLLTFSLFGCQKAGPLPETEKSAETPSPKPTEKGWMGLPERHYDDDEFIYDLKNRLIPEEIRNIENSGDGLIKEEDYIEHQLKKTPENTDYLFLLAYNQFDREKYDSALCVFERILKISKDSERAVEGTVYCHYKKEDYRKARKMAEEALKKFPGNPRLLHMLAGSYLYGDRNPALAARIYQKALKADSKDPRIWLGLAEAHVEMKTPEDSQKAVEIMKETIRRFPRYHIVYILLAEELQLQGRYQESLDRLEEAIERDPLYYRAYSIIGDIFKDIGREDEALKYYLKALKTNPVYEGLIYVKLGDFYRDRNEYKTASDYYLKALEIRDEKNTDEPNQESAGACVGMALLNIRNRQLKEAEKYISRAYEDYPQYELNVIAHSALFAAKGQFARARQTLEKGKKASAENRPDDSEIYYHKARICEMEGNRKEALKNLHQSLSSLPGFRKLQILNRIEKDNVLAPMTGDPEYKGFKEKRSALLRDAEKLKLKKNYVE